MGGRAEGQACADPSARTPSALAVFFLMLLPDNITDITCDDICLTCTNLKFCLLCFESFQTTVIAFFMINTDSLLKNVSGS